jgi:hypothetical protein
MTRPAADPPIARDRPLTTSSRPRRSGDGDSTPVQRACRDVRACSGDPSPVCTTHVLLQTMIGRARAKTADCALIDDAPRRLIQLRSSRRCASVSPECRTATRSPKRADPAHGLRREGDLEDTTAGACALERRRTPAGTWSCPTPSPAGQQRLPLPTIRSTAATASPRVRVAVSHRR